MLYYSFIYPVLSYRILIWGNAANYLLEKIFRIQKEFVRCILNKKWLDHTGPLFTKLHMLRLYDLYECHVVIFVFKVKHQMLPLCMNCIIFSKNNKHVLRNKGKV